MLNVALFIFAGNGINLDAHCQIKSQENCGTYTQWKITHP